jgi:hypothetical protein
VGAAFSRETNANPKPYFSGVRFVWDYLTNTMHAGLALLGEFTIGLGLLEALDKSLPAPGRGAVYRASEDALPLMLRLGFNLARPG